MHLGSSFQPHPVMVRSARGNCRVARAFYFLKTKREWGSLRGVSVPVDTRLASKGGTGSRDRRAAWRCRCAPSPAGRPGAIRSLSWTGSSATGTTRPSNCWSGGAGGWRRKGGPAAPGIFDEGAATCRGFGPARAGSATPRPPIARSWARGAPTPLGYPRRGAVQRRKKPARSGRGTGPRRRKRANPCGPGCAEGLVVSLAGAAWHITDAADFHRSATFTVRPPDSQGRADAWKGTRKLPAVKDALRGRTHTPARGRAAVFTGAERFCPSVFGGSCGCFTALAASVDIQSLIGGTGAGYHQMRSDQTSLVTLPDLSPRSGKRFPPVNSRRGSRSPAPAACPTYRG